MAPREFITPRDIRLVEDNKPDNLAMVETRGNVPLIADIDGSVLDTVKGSNVHSPMQIPAREAQHYSEGLRADAAPTAIEAATQKAGMYVSVTMGEPLPT